MSRAAGNEKAEMLRRVYVLPAELVDRIEAFQVQQGFSSEVEAVRRLLDEALMSRDTPFTIVARFQERLKITPYLPDVAKDILVGHPLITHIDQSEKDAVAFTIKDVGEYKIDWSGRASVLTDVDDFDGPGHWVPFHATPPAQKKPALLGRSNLDDEIPF